MADCPLMVKYRMANTRCDFPELCRGTRCLWANFHEVDAHTGKPLTEAAQPDLFCEAVSKPTGELP